MVDSAFGKVQEGSPISHQHPLPVSQIAILHPDAPPPPPLPLDGYMLEPTNCQCVCTLQQQLHRKSLETTLGMVMIIEVATSEQGDCVEWHRVRRITSSHFRDICHVHGQSSTEHLAERIWKEGAEMPVMKRGLALSLLRFRSIAG